MSGLLAVHLAVKQYTIKKWGTGCIDRRNVPLSGKQVQR